jgi:histidine transport system ATP-binding protein
MTPMNQLEITGLHKRFGALHVLRGISMNASKGDVISVIGSSGSGKSTFLRCINLLEQPTEGTIRVNDSELKLRRNRHGDLESADRRQLQSMRSKVAMVFQHFNLWPHMTILENAIEAPMHVLGMSRRSAEERAKGYLDRVGLSSKFGAYPAHLSGGQQQRAAIARALTVEPEVLLFDEPTSALDPELVGEVLRVMQGLAAERRTMVIVTHEMTFARNVSNRMMFLHQGQVEEEGTPEQLFGAPRSERLRQFLSATST